MPYLLYLRGNALVSQMLVFALFHAYLAVKLLLLVLLALKLVTIVDGSLLPTVARGHLRWDKGGSYSLHVLFKNYIKEFNRANFIIINLSSFHQRSILKKINRRPQHLSTHQTFSWRLENSSNFVASILLRGIQRATLEQGRNRKRIGREIQGLYAANLPWIGV